MTAVHAMRGGPLRATLALAIGASACAADVTPPTTVPDRAFPAPFEEVSAWQEIGVDPPRGHPLAEGSTDLAAFTAALRDYLTAAQPDLGDDAVTVEIPAGLEPAGGGEIFVQVVGGMTPAEAGMQWRIPVTREGGVWKMDGAAQVRVFCHEPLGGVRRNRCS